MSYKTKLWTDKSGRIFRGSDYNQQNQIDEAKERTEARACFRSCHTCGTCANSKRDNSYPFSYDANAKKKIDCRKCEPFRFHDCNNGFMRNAHGEAEPFTPDQLKLIEESPGNKPLM